MKHNKSLWNLLESLFRFQETINHLDQRGSAFTEFITNRFATSALLSLEPSSDIKPIRSDLMSLFNITFHLCCLTFRTEIFSPFALSSFSKLLVSVFRRSTSSWSNITRSVFSWSDVANASNVARSVGSRGSGGNKVDEAERGRLRPCS